MDADWLAEIEDDLEVPEKTVEQERTSEEMIDFLTSLGFVLVKQPVVENRSFDISTHTFDGQSFKIGVVSDTHLCSKYQQLSFLWDTYQYFHSVGIDTVVHAGDLSAGNGKVYRGQQFELAVLGAKHQRDYIRDRYPYIPGITTYVISGNHDLSYLMSEGLDLIEWVAQDRPDIKYLGQYGATVNIHGIKIYLHHGDGGVPYARSYKLQKMIEQLSPQIKPNIFIGGHYHITCTLKMYRNVYGMFAGCFESQTPYLVRKGLYPEIGATILDVTYDSNGLIRVHDEWIPFFVPKEDDY
jgi:predicted phosphodiesterase